MSVEYKLELSRKCWFEYTDWGSESFFDEDITLCYTQESPDPWYSDSIGEAYINEDKAKEIVEFLKKKYPNI